MFSRTRTGSLGPIYDYGDFFWNKKSATSNEIDVLYREILAANTFLHWERSFDIYSEWIMHNRIEQKQITTSKITSW